MMKEDPTLADAQRFIAHAEKLAEKVRASEELDPVKRWQLSLLYIQHLIDAMPASLTMSDAPEIADAIDTICGEADFNSQVMGYFESEGEEVDFWEESDRFLLVFDDIPDQVRAMTLEAIGRVTDIKPLVEEEDNTVYALFNR